MAIALVPVFAAVVTAQNGGATDAAKLCRSVSTIRQLPKDYGVRGADAAYDAIVAGGESVVPCLIDNITNTRVMTDPRCPTISTATTIGDISYFLLIDILKLKFTDLLPLKVRQDYKTTGAYAYHRHIDRPGARKQLQAKLRHWYADNKDLQRF